MEENKELNEEVKVEEPKEKKKAKINIEFDIEKCFTVLFAFSALVLLAIKAVVAMFYGYNPRIFRGIVGILAYSSAIGGIFFSYMKDKKPCFEFWLNVGALIILIMYF